MAKCNYVAFSDECNYSGSDRYGSCALITGEINDSRKLHKDLKKVLKENVVSEIKWKILGKKKDYNKTAEQFFKIAFDYIYKNKIRIDVICWDLKDSRNNVKGRDNIANFHRMIHHLLKNALTSRWPKNLTWCYYPDVNDSVEWDEVKYFLNLKQVYCHDDQIIISDKNSSFSIFYNIKEVQPKESKEFMIIQLADLFAGLQTYSRINYKKYSQYIEESSTQNILFKRDHRDFIQLSNADKSKLPLIRYVYEQCKLLSLSTAINKENGIYSRNPDDRLNYWIYIPQNEKDKAPIK